MLYARQAQLIELRSETADLRKTADDLEKRQPTKMNDDISQKLDEKEKEIYKQEGQQDIDKKYMTPTDQKQDGLELSNPNLGIIDIDERRSNVNSELDNQGLTTRDEPDYYHQMEISTHSYNANDPRYFVFEHLAAVRDLAFHPHLMLLASVSDDGTAALTDVSYAVRHTQNDSQQQNIPKRPMIISGSQYQSQSQQQQAISASLFQTSSSSSQTNTFIPIKSLDPKWHFKPSRQHSIKQLKDKAQQQGRSQTDIQYNLQRPLCVKFLPYLESSNDKQRKQQETINSQSSSSSKPSSPPQKRMAIDLGCFVMGDNNGKITVMALPDPKVQMIDTHNKLEKNKMFEFSAHSDAIWSIDESNQRNGVFSGSQIPPSGQKSTQTRIVSASSDGTVKLWNINTDGIQDHIGRELEYHKMMQEFKHTPSIASSVVIDWNAKRLKANETNQIQYFKPIEQIKDIWEDSDIPSAVIFDPMNVTDLIVGYVSGDLVRFDIEKGENNQSQIGKTNQPERIISLTKSMTATHYQTQDTIPLLVTTNHGYLHIVDPREFHTLFSFKAPLKRIDQHQSISYSTKFSMALQQRKLTFLPADHIQISNFSSLCNNSDIINQIYPNKSIKLELRLRYDSDQMKQIQMEQIERQKYQFSPLEKWREDLRLQIASPNIFTSSTYLQFDRLIAAGTNSGRVHIFDLRMGDKGQVGIVGETNQYSFHSPMFSESITKIAAHPIHPILVTAGADGNIKVFTSNQP